MISSIIRRWIIQRNWLSQFYSRGLLFHRQVADYAYDDNWKRMFTAVVYWIPNVSWVADGKFYSSSSSLYGIDMALGAVADLVDIDAANKAAEAMGYTWKQELGFF